MPQLFDSARIRQFARSGLIPVGLLMASVVAAACGSGTDVGADATSIVPSPTANVIETAVVSPTSASTATSAPTINPSPSPTVTATRTASPNLSSTATATATAAPSTGVGRSTETVAELSARALVHLTELSEGLPPRVSGTDGELAAAGYVADQLRSSGFDVQLHEFTARSRPRDGNHLQVTSPEPRPIRTNIFTGSGEGDITGPLVSVGLAREGDLPSFALTGMVALVERGEIPFTEKARNVFEAGAGGMVVFNNNSEIFDGTLGEGFKDVFDRPSVTISGVNGDALIEELKLGPVNVNLRLVTDERPSRNVVATKPGPGDVSPVVIIGGHIDAVPDSPGANDNASGTATFLVIAEELANADLPFELRVIGFGSEELGLLGSVAYVASLDEAEKERVIAMFNYDALGSGSLEIGGHFELTDRGLEVAEEISIAAVHGIEPVNATSDHASFRDAGIRSMFFFGSDFSLIHTPLDTIEAMNPENMGMAAAITLNGLLDGLIAE